MTMGKMLMELFLIFLSCLERNLHPPPTPTPILMVAPETQRPSHSHECLRHNSKTKERLWPPLIKAPCKLMKVFGQELLTLLGVTCCVRLHSLLYVVTCCWELWRKFWNRSKALRPQLPTKFILFLDRRSVALYCWIRFWGHAWSPNSQVRSLTLTQLLDC